MNKAGRIIGAALVLQIAFSAFLWWASSEVYFFIIPIFFFAVLDVMVAVFVLVGVGVKEAFS